MQIRRRKKTLNKLYIIHNRRLNERLVITTIPPVSLLLVYKIDMIKSCFFGKCEIRVLDVFLIIFVFVHFCICFLAHNESWFVQVCTTSPVYLSAPR